MYTTAKSRFAVDVTVNMQEGTCVYDWKIIITALRMNVEVA